jgi:hypothetical protein
MKNAGYNDQDERYTFTIPVNFRYFAFRRHHNTTNASLWSEISSKKINEMGFIKILAYSLLPKISALVMSHDKKNLTGGHCGVCVQV